ncbi:hypothetical protein [Bacillus sp. FJAT-27245]|uniref:hypothetical protein n=1 Tax=Bacillus sp. FJAT-27245 TaxID=1684144 RepID=UPI000ABBB16D|nr:hypothetical protein [Bacillus sp. FJAT-27245]
MIDGYKSGTSTIFLFKSDAKKAYRTVLAEKSGLLFYRSYSSTFIPYNSDKIQTVGGMSVTTENTEVSFLSIVSNDEKVAYIEAGEEPDVERKKVKKGERISFLFPYSMQIDFLNAKAYDQNGNALYYYGYPKGTTIFSPEDLKWHKINEEL